MHTSKRYPTKRRLAALLLPLVSSCVSPSYGFQQSLFRPATTRGIEPTATIRSRRSADTRSYAVTGANEEKFDAELLASVTPPIRQDDNQERRRRRDLLATRRREETKLEDEARDKDDQSFLVLALFPSFFAFISWEEISHSLAVFLDKYGAVGKAVDGGQFATNLLRPTITGVVVPVISIALATLVSTTINVLRARQVELRALVNKESCELRLLRRAVFGMFGTRQHASRRARAMALMCAYVEQLERESSVGAVDALEELQLSGGIAVNELDRLSEMLHGVDGAAASRQGSVSVADGLILSLNEHRSDRVALVLSVFPLVHWGVIIALSISVIATFLLVSNQQVLQYLNSLQLRALFAILVGVCSGTATLCLDLADPFRGSFSIAEASTQLGDLRVCLKEDVAEASAEAGEISSSLVRALLLGGTRDSRYSTDTEKSMQLTDEMPLISGDSADSSKRNYGSDISNRGSKWGNRERYGIVSTLYFHLLTGPLGSNARVLGDVIAWVASFVGSRARSLSQRVVALSRAVGRKFRRGQQKAFNSK